MDGIFDQELAGMVNFTDETAPAEMPALECEKHEPKKQPAPKKSEVKDADYCPFPEKQKTAMDRLQSCCVWLGICGGISMLMWWFWMNGLMAMEAAYPCILASAAIGGIGVGRSSK